MPPSPVWSTRPPLQGGTLNVEARRGDCDSWDPARTYYGWCWNMQRLFTRTLMGYEPVPDANDVTIVPDLATGSGQHNADDTSGPTT